MHKCRCSTRSHGRPGKPGGWSRSPAAEGGAQLVDVGTAALTEADLLRAVAGSLLLVDRTTVRDTAGRPWCNSYSRLRPDVSQVEFEVSVGDR